MICIKNFTLKSFLALFCSFVLSLKVNGVGHYKTVEYNDGTKVFYIPTEKIEETLNLVHDSSVTFLVNDSKLLVAYVDVIREALASDKNTKDTSIESVYPLTLKDTTGNEAVEHRNKLYDIVSEALVNYGLENLPKEPKGFLGKIFEEDVYTQKKFLFWKYGKEDLSSSKISLIKPDGNNDEKKIYKSGKDTEKKVNIDQTCVIF